MVAVAAGAGWEAVADPSPAPSPAGRAFQYSFARTRTPVEEALNPAWRATNLLTQRLLGGQSTDPRAAKALRVRKNLQGDSGRSFPCNVTARAAARSPVRPTSVHRLRPGDVDVVAAMGDSLTAANGAMALNVPQVSNENRGVSWSGGGQGTWREYLTLPNILKEFNPALVGYSLKDSRAFQRASAFNVAEINSMTQDLPWQANNLVKRIRSDPRVDVQRDWKLVTILVGSNDICSDVCFRRDPESLPEQHRQDLKEALRILKKNLPRTFVNLVLQPNLGQILPTMKKTSVSCEMIRRIACSCLYGEMTKSVRGRTRKIIERYIQVEWEMGDDPEFQTDDFALVVQPFTYKVKFPMKNENATDFSYLAPDCFHFSQRGYARAANALWNNMLEPVGGKATDWSDIFNPFHCPSEEHPYLYTARNSRGESRGE
ncbi:Phospholipase B1, membrane-associated [Frankliniella fusca]|uniref:Phospholipase B1, membrane-associated n=1 Tax=Frankliniella fusca TaxID=407009 RepID=A0AAE1HCF8_9NEOP|nr:Phospholipase B1, membrane-associated [Frankliniella fusca]